MDTTADPQALNPSDASAKERFKSRRLRVLGLDIQDIIKYFFGGSASLAIIILVLICVFLLREALGFFPAHHSELKLYRKAGLEFVDYINEVNARHADIVGRLRVAVSAEVGASSEEESKITTVYGSLERLVNDHIEPLDAKLKTFNKRLEDDEFTLEIQSGAIKTKTDAGEEVPAEQRAQVEALENQVADYKTRIAAVEAQRLAEAKAFLASEAVMEAEGMKGLEREVREQLVDSVGVKISTGETADYITELEASISEKWAASNESFADLRATVDEIAAAIDPMRKIWSDGRDIVSPIKADAVAHHTAADRRNILLTAAKEATSEERRKELEEEAAGISLEAVDFEARIQPLLETKPSTIAALKQLRADMEAGFAKLPEKLQTSRGDSRLQLARTKESEFQKFVEATEGKVENWDWSKNYSFFKSVMAFFVGKNWVTNSSWFEFYGLLPLFTGSLLIAVIAILVSVPFAVGAAIYVNQLCSQHEQNFIKPAIEFIEAIPSIVLGFFGIMVLGSALREVSQVEWLSWVPGFPMSERLNILNAGLLLALMAVPTIFTLAEDAINNVPQAYTQGSFALGASKLQTVIRVIVPTALSGIIAAVLLGFGRIVGETMVVLLVAGNKINMPDFSLGIGVITQPTHTMTGIIAQELGEVNAGSLHWRALFMVGMVLFVISLVINYSAQQVIKKFHRA